MPRLGAVHTITEIQDQDPAQTVAVATAKFGYRSEGHLGQYAKDAPPGCGG